MKQKTVEILKWIGARATERTTWLGILTVLTAAGVGLSPDQAQAIISIGSAIGGLILVITKDAPKDPPA